MTWIGKTLVIFNFLLALLWCGLTAATFAARSNWKAEADRARAESKVAAEDAESYRKAINQERVENSALRAQLAASVAREHEIAQANGANYAQLNDVFSQRLQEDRKNDPQMQTSLINTGKVQTDLDDKNAKLKELEKQTDDLTKKVQLYLGQAADAVRMANGSKVQTDALQAKLLAAAADMERFRNRGGAKGAVAAPENFRATITEVNASRDGVYVSINQGVNSGLQDKTVLRVTRGNQFVGYLTVESTEPAKATCTFTRSGGAKASGDSLPKVNDVVQGQ